MNDSDQQFTSPVFSYQTLQQAVVNPYGKPVKINGMPEKDLSEPSKPPSKADSFKAGVFIAVFILALIAAPVLAQTEPSLCIADVGGIFLVIGLINLFQDKFGLRRLPFMLVPIAGALMVGIPVINYYHKTHPESIAVTQSTVIKIAAAGFVVIGVLLPVFTILSRALSLGKCTQKINAMCIYRNTRPAVSKRANNRTRRYDLYSITWQYEVNNIIYVTREPDYTDEDVPDIGECREINFCPDDPSVIYRDLKQKVQAALITGAASTVLGAIAFFAV